jgi:hypothetical protein
MWLEARPLQKASFREADFTGLGAFQLGQAPLSQGGGIFTEAMLAASAA